jgi:c-di-GMP-binding flagellar brake protein YcgR
VFQVRESVKVEVRNQLGRSRSNEPVENRRHRRFKLDVEVSVYPRNKPVVRAHAVDISESGMAVMLRDELPIGEMVRLEFTLDMGAVDVHAMVCHRNAFRYGLQFVASAPAQDIIGRTCGQLALEQALFDPKPL